MILKISLTILLSALLLWGFVSLMDPDEQEVMKEVGAAMVFLLATIVGSAIVAMLYVWIWSL